MAQYTRTQPMHRPGQNEHGHGALAYGGKQVGVAQARPAAPYAPNYAPAQLRLHQASYGSSPLYSYGRSAGEYRAGARMSLLGSAYLPPPAPPAHHPPPADPPPFKKIRLSADHHPQPLRVDTREPVMNSYSTVEVLSPNPPSEPTIEDQNFRTTKDDLLQQISKVDREMALSETTLAKLKKKQEELEQSASKPAAAAEPEEAPPRHRSLAQCIYADNRKRAAAGHTAMAHLGPAVTYPLYNQPQDTLIYHENIRKHKTFRRRLALHLRNLKMESEKREDALAEAYSRRASEWMRRVERIEQGQKRKAKDARNREFFEKVFPELRKQREERERLLRLGARVKSEAELEEIADGLHEQEHEDKKMRSLTVVPPLLRDPRLPRLPLDVNQRKVDMETEHKELQLRNVWSPAEKDLFRDKFLQHPKNFGQISSFLPRKTVRDCVRFYYLSKKAENYKQLLRKPRPRRHARPRPPPEPELVHASSGVTTRLQRSQGTRVADKDTSSLEEVVVADINGIPMPPHAPPSAHPSRSELSRTPPLPPSPPLASSAPPAVSIGLATPLPSLEQSPTTPSMTGVDGEAGQSESVCVSAISLPPGSPTAPEPTPPPADAVLPLSDTTSVITTTSSQMASVSVVSGGASAGGSQPPTPQPAPPTPQPTPPTSQTNPPTPQPASTPTHTPPTPEPAVTERTSSPVTVTCAVCSTGSGTRSVPASNAAQYGLEAGTAGHRVCEACHCRVLRASRSRCPVRSCAGPRAQRLRHLPPAWHDLPLNDKKPIMDEFKIPSTLSKCCLTCFKRITRRLEAAGVTFGEPSEEEAARFRTLLRDCGTAWDRMAAASGRSAASLKAFYFTYRRRLRLDAGSPRARSGSDDSGSSGDTDTASAGSPRPPPLPGPRTDAAAPRRPKRDEYDSSATETADEENDAPSAKTAASGVSAVSTASAVSLATTVSGVNAVSGVSVATSSPCVTAQLTVRDVVLNMIEVSLMKNSRPPSIPYPPKQQQQQTQPNHELATLTVVSGGQHSSAVSPRGATPLPAEGAPDLVLLQVDRPAPSQPDSLLDLTVKRPRLDRHPPPSPYRTAEYAAGYRGTERQSPTQYAVNKPKPAASPRPALKLPNPKGSITLGTPVESRFEAQRTPPDPKTGSITAGTPLTPLHHLPDKRYFDRRRSPGGGYYARPQSPQSFSTPPNAATSRGPYGLERRQIMLTDFITSQQMHPAARRDRDQQQQHQQPQPPQQQHQQHQHQPMQQHQIHQIRRDRDTVSVIQRHSHTYSHPVPPPGHEAFTSLVNAASAAAALPVPRTREPDPDNHHHHHPQHQQHQQHQQHSHHDIRSSREFPLSGKYASGAPGGPAAGYDERRPYDRAPPARDSRERLVSLGGRRYVVDDRHLHEHHQVVSSQEEKRFSNNAAYSIAGKPRPHGLERKDARGPPVSCPSTVSSSSGPPAPPVAVPGAQATVERVRSTDGTLTAASLINAIITHQISQTTDQRFPAERVPGPGERVVVGQERGPERRDEPPPGALHTTSIKLGDLASNIIVRDFSSPTTTTLMHHKILTNAETYQGGGGASVSSGSGTGPTTSGHSYFEPVSPTDNNQPTSRSDNRYTSSASSVSGVGGVSGVSGVSGVRCGVLTAYDYVTARIVDVMRNDSEAKLPFAAETKLPFNTPYTYPYSALNVATPADPSGGPGVVSSAPPPAGPAPPEPAPLMSAQYEPLSDED